jgi:Flp pilus assembly protein TadB
MVAALGVAMLGIPCLSAQDHIVSAGDLHNEIASAAQARQANVAKIRKFFSSESAQKALKTARMDPQKVQKAVPYLSDRELARLASQSEKAQADFAAGTMSDRDLLYILLGIAALVLIIVAVR